MVNQDLQFLSQNFGGSTVLHQIFTLNMYTKILVNPDFYEKLKSVINIFYKKMFT